MKKYYHTFKRILPDAEPGDEPWIVKAEVKPGAEITKIRLSEEHVLNAINRRGFADGQNCAGGICVVKHKKAFSHPTMPLVDWWYRRVFICETINRKTGKAICREYAHYDGIAELFDGGPRGLEKLLNRVRKHGYIEITLYPVKRGLHPRTGEKTRPAGSSGDSGLHRKPRPIGTELRVLTNLRAFSDVTPAV